MKRFFDFKAFTRATDDYFEHNNRVVSCSDFGFEYYNGQSNIGTNVKLFYLIDNG